MRSPILLTLLCLAACSDDPTGPAGTSDGGRLADSGVSDGGLADGGPTPVPTCRPAFGMAEACGGDLVGTWTYRAGCSDDVDLGGITAQCPALMAREVARTSMGTLTVNADRTFVRDARGSASYEMDVPGACAMAVGGCAGFATAAGAALGSAVTCTADGTDCDCTATVPYTVDDRGTYTVAGGVVTIVASGGGTSSYHFCARDGALEYRRVTGAGEPKDAVFVATK